MDPIIQYRNEMQGAREAKDLIESPVFLRMIASAEQRCTEMWVGSEPGQVAIREQAYATRRALVLILDAINAEVAKGEMASAQLKRRKL